MADKEPIVVMIAGQPRKGKSTALNNLFGLNLEARPSAKSVTLKFTPTTVIKEDQELIVIDTPGLGALDLPSTEALKEVRKYTEGLDFTLIYCLSVNINDTLTITDRNIIEYLHRYLHKQIWKKCIILLTFSDKAREDDSFSGDSENYIAYLREHCEEFRRLLESKGVLDLPVKTIFDYSTDDERKSTNLEGIVAVPVAKQRTTKNIMPGIDINDMDWTEIVFNELLKRVNPADRLKFIDFKYAAATAGGAAGAGAAMGALGAGAGLGIGVLGGPIGMGVGAVIGGAAGGVFGAATGTSISAIYRFIRWKKANPELKIKRIVEIMEANKKRGTLYN